MCRATRIFFNSLLFTLFLHNFRDVSATESDAADSVLIGDYDPRYGTYVGEFNTLWHDVVGSVYAVDNITIHVRGFSYDGEAPDAYFFAGNRTPKPTNRGFIIPNEKDDKEVLGPYRKRNLVLKFPITKKGQRGFYDIKWISVWCERFAIDFGHVVLPEGLSPPAPAEGDGLSSDAPALSSSAVMRKDRATVVLKDFSYDGSLPDAIFVAGAGLVDAAGVQLPDEKGTLEPLGKYSRKTITLTLPKEVQESPLQYVGVWSPSEGVISSSTLDVEARIPPARATLK